jgi:alpha-beta hydrolase superfamily lysophospholipase
MFIKEERMKHQEGFFRGVQDTNIYYQSWLLEGDPRAVLLIAHGLAEHSGRYMNVVNHFVPLGYAVYGLDHFGHGKSNGKRVYVERFEDFIETLKIYFDMVRDWQPEKPIFLVGHSMGGLISSVYLLKYQAGLTGVVLSGPAMKVPDSLSPVIIFVGKMLSMLLPRVGLIQLEAEGVSRDPAVVQAYINDPLVVYPGKMTARLGAELIKAMQRITAEAWKITLPILILQGSADRLVDPAGAQMLYDTVSSTDKTLKIYDGLYHEVFNEPEHGQILSDVEAWLKIHLEQNQ